MWTPLLARAKRRSPLSFTPASRWKLGVAALALSTLGALPATAQLNYPVRPRTAATANLPGRFVTTQTFTTLSSVGGATDLTQQMFDNASAFPLDDANSDELTLGFNFPFTGGNFNRIIVNTNGFFKLGDAGMTPPGESLGSVTANSPYNILNSAAAEDINIISAFTWDLDANPEAPSAVTTGSPAGSFWFFSNADSAIVEWKNVHDLDYGTAGSRTQYTSFTFQAKIFPSGVVKFVQHGDGERECGCCGQKRAGGDQGLGFNAGYAHVARFVLVLAGFARNDSHSRQWYLRRQGAGWHPSGC